MSSRPPPNTTNMSVEAYQEEGRVGTEEGRMGVSEGQDTPIRAGLVNATNDLQNTQVSQVEVNEENQRNALPSTMAASISNGDGTSDADGVAVPTLCEEIVEEKEDASIAPMEADEEDPTSAPTPSPIDTSLNNSTTNHSTNNNDDNDNNNNNNTNNDEDDDSSNVTEIDLDGADAAQHLYNNGDGANNNQQYLARLERLNTSPTAIHGGRPNNANLTRGLFWTEAETQAYEERRRDMLLRELNRVQRANFVHFCLLFLMPTGLLLVVLLSAFTDQSGEECGNSGVEFGVDGGEDLANCYFEKRTFMNAFASRCICDAFEVVMSSR